MCCQASPLPAAHQCGWATSGVICGPERSAAALCWQMLSNWHLDIRPSSVLLEALDWYCFKFQTEHWPKHNKTTLSYMSKSCLISGFWSNMLDWELILSPASLTRSYEEWLLVLFKCWARFKLTWFFYDCRTKQSVSMIHYHLCSMTSSVVWGNVNIAIPVLFSCPTTSFPPIN